MPLKAFALVVLAGLIHALWNIAAKKVGGDARFALFTAALLLLVWAPAGWWFGRIVVPLWGALEWALVGASGALHVVYFVTLLRGYRKADLTVVYPVARGSGPLFSSLAAVALLGERLTFLGASGVLGVVLGVFLIAGGPGLLRARHSAVARARLRKGVGYGALTGLCIAAYTVVDGYAVKAVLMSPIVLHYMGDIVRAALLLPVALQNRATTAALWRIQWPYALLVAAISPVAYVLVLYAMQIAPLSHVAPAREVSMLFAASIGGRLLGEGERATRLAGSICIAAGVTALAWG